MCETRINPQSPAATAPCEGGRPAGRGTAYPTTGSAGGPPFPAELGRAVRPDGILPQPTGEEIAALARKVDSLAALVLAQNAAIERMAAMLEERRVTRSQESALKIAIHRRAEEVCREAEFSGREASRRVNAAIRKTVREVSGCRAVGDIPAAQFEKILRLIVVWNMAGAIRRIRRDLSHRL